ncbi:MAG: T9SS type A sorting domain-containing protein [Flavobacteriales bacterium]|nr:T9SS type A sorting domain-containing protein [Flavobacteriales bacterium]
MKTLQLAFVLICSSLMCWSSRAEAQYNVLPVGDGLWVQSFWVGPGFPYSGWAYAVPGISDTVVSGVAYRSVNLGLNGFLRDDSLGHVFWLDGVGGQEVMLYDFTASAGDTIIYPPGLVFHDSLLVLEVDTILVNGTERRMLTVSLELVTWGGGLTSQWIQGIGSTGGLFNLCQGPSVSGTSWLTCMSENGVAQYGGNTGEPYDCLVHLSVDELTDDRQQHGIHPNPSTGVFQLTGTAPILEVRVLDTQGREVLRTRDRTFDLTGHSPGIYMMVVITGSSRQVIRSLLVTP